MRCPLFFIRKVSGRRRGWVGSMDIISDNWSGCEPCVMVDPSESGSFGWCIWSSVWPLCSKCSGEGMISSSSSRYDFDASVHFDRIKYLENN